MSIAEKLKTIAENEQKVYEAGYEKGKSEGGADSYYDTFWDSYQDNGNRTDYLSAFSGKGWNDNTFVPKYKMQPVNADRMFGWSNISSIECGEGKAIDFVNSTTLQDCFRSMANLTEVGDINGANITTMNICFQECHKLVKIGTITVNEKTTLTNVFHYCYSLTTVKFKGTIGKTINLAYSELLSKESIISTINALSDNTSDLSVDFSRTAVNNAFETSVGAADGSTSDEWKNLIATKPNWTIALG
jgi:hypothetical protein